MEKDEFLKNQKFDNSYLFFLIIFVLLFGKWDDEVKEIEDRRTVEDNSKN